MFTLDFEGVPPSDNTMKTPLLINGKARIVKSDPHRDFKKLIRKLWLQAGFAPAGVLKGPVVVTMQVSVPRVDADGPNMWKAMLDALTGLAYVDDQQVVDAHLYKRMGKSHTRITVRELPFGTDTADLYTRLLRSTRGTSKKPKVTVHGQPAKVVSAQLGLVSVRPHPPQESLAQRLNRLARDGTVRHR